MKAFALVLAAFVAAASAPAPAQTSRSASQGATAPSRAASLPDFTALVKKQGPAVVNVTSKSRAAGAQGRFWLMHDLLFEHHDELELEDLLGYAAKLDLDVERFARALNEEQYAETVREDVASAEASGARRTPTFFIGNRRHIGPHDTETLARELAALRSSYAAIEEAS